MNIMKQLIAGAEMPEKFAIPTGKSLEGDKEETADQSAVDTQCGFVSHGRQD